MLVKDLKQWNLLNSMQEYRTPGNSSELKTLGRTNASYFSPWLVLPVTLLPMAINPQTLVPSPPTLEGLKQPTVNGGALGRVLGFFDRGTPAGCRPELAWKLE